MYISPARGAEKSLHPPLFFFGESRLNSRLKEVLFSEVPLLMGVVTGMGDFLDAVIVSH